MMTRTLLNLLTSAAVALAFVSLSAVCANAAPPTPSQSAMQNSGRQVARWGVRAYSGSNADLRRLKAHQAAYRKARSERNFKALAKMDTRFLALVSDIAIADEKEAKKLRGIAAEFRGLSGNTAEGALLRKQALIRGAVLLTERLAAAR